MDEPLDHSAVDLVAETIAEYQAPNSWEIYGDESKKPYRDKASAIIRALIANRYMEAE
jgi:hypothetical protein